MKLNARPTLTFAAAMALAVLGFGPGQAQELRLLTWADYAPDALADWAARLHAVTGWKRVYVYLKHDEAGRAPDLAQRFLGALP